MSVENAKPKSEARKRQIANRRATASRYLVRPDYHRKITLTYAEAAEIAGVSVHTVECWIWEGKIPRFNRIGPYKIHIDHLREYLKTGKRVSAP